LGILLAVMLTLSLAEGLLPPILPPFGRIGLPNIVVLYCLQCMGRREAGAMVLLKAGFALLTRGGAAGLLSLCGGLSSFGALLLLQMLTKRRASLAALGVTGAVAHNIGQLAGFSFIAKTNVFPAYLPVMLIAGVLTGFATGTVFRLTLPMLRRAGALVLGAVFLLTAGCTPSEKRFEFIIEGPFDTVSRIVVTAPRQIEAENAFKTAETMIWEMHRLFDIYHNYQGLNNLKTINDNAGIQPVTVDPLITELLTFCKQAYHDTEGAVNIALGAVLALWREARETGVPPGAAALEEAAKHSDIRQLVLDKDIAYLADGAVSIDVGAVAKGFAARKVAEALRDEGFGNVLVDMGGDVVGLGSPPGAEGWSIGIRDPFDKDGFYDIIYISDSAVASSGAYERGGHIIDPYTLRPADRYASVTVVHKDGAVAEMLSTALFILPEGQGRKISSGFGAEVVYIYRQEPPAASPLSYGEASRHVGSVYLTAEKDVAWFDSDRTNESPGHALILDHTGAVVYDGAFTRLRGRGNTTWNLPKKPYNIRFADAQSLFGMAPSRKFVILANAQDDTMLRNKVLLDLAAAVGMPYSPKSVFAELYINGEYRGLYQITEKIEIGKNYYMNNFVNDPGDITGPYLFEGYYKYEENGFQARRGGGLALTSPERASAEQLGYIKNFFDDMEEAVFASSGINTKGRRFDEYINMESAAKMFLLQEFCKNHDGTSASNFFWKESDLYGDGLLHFGPVWDFDIAFGNAGFWGENNGSYTNIDLSDPEGMWLIHSQNHPARASLYAGLWQHEAFRKAVRDEWEGVSLAIEAMLEDFDSYYQTLSQAAARNYELWGKITWGRDTDARARGDYAYSFNHLKEFMEKRLDYMNGEEF
jgi:thiamine biosynthesis lipoprotein